MTLKEQEAVKRIVDKLLQAIPTMKAVKRSGYAELELEAKRAFLIKVVRGSVLRKRPVMAEYAVELLQTAEL